jgi:class 3 adenylate cyclase
VPDDITTLLLRLIGGNPDAPAEVVQVASSSTSPSLLVAAALVAQDPEYLTRAARHASTTRDRQLVALADADLQGRADLLDALVRDHLADHPDHLLAAWIAGRHLPRHQ